MPQKLSQKVLDKFAEIDLKVIDPPTRTMLKEKLLDLMVRRNEDLVEETP